MGYPQDFHDFWTVVVAVAGMEVELESLEELEYFLKLISLHLTEGPPIEMCWTRHDNNIFLSQLQRRM